MKGYTMIKNTKSFLTSALENVRAKQTVDGDDTESTTDTTNATQRIVVKVALLAAVTATAIYAVKHFSSPETEAVTEESSDV